MVLARNDNIVEACWNCAWTENRERAKEGLPDAGTHKYAVVGLLISLFTEAIVIPPYLARIAVVFEDSRFIDSVEHKLHVREVKIIEYAFKPLVHKLHLTVLAGVGLA